MGRGMLPVSLGQMNAKEELRTENNSRTQTKFQQDPTNTEEIRPMERELEVHQ